MVVGERRRLQVLLSQVSLTGEYLKEEEYDTFPPLPKARAFWGGKGRDNLQSPPLSLRSNIGGKLWGSSTSPVGMVTGNEPWVLRPAPVLSKSYQGLLPTMDIWSWLVFLPMGEIHGGEDRGTCGTSSLSACLMKGSFGQGHISLPMADCSRQAWVDGKL